MKHQKFVLLLKTTNISVFEYQSHACKKRMLQSKQSFKLWCQMRMINIVIEYLHPLVLNRSRLCNLKTRSPADEKNLSEGIDLTAVATCSSFFAMVVLFEQLLAFLFPYINRWSFELFSLKEAFSSQVLDT